VLALYGSLLLCGFAAGLYMVPLNALLQELPAKKEKGRVIGTNNFFNGIAMIIAVFCIGFLQSVMAISPAHIMGVIACLTLGFNGITLFLRPQFFRQFLRMLKLI
jgi:MFS family permease